MEIRDYFTEQLDQFLKVHDAAIAASRLTEGRPTPSRIDAWPSWIFSKVLLVGMSLRILIDAGLREPTDKYTIDCGAIGTLARTIIEGVILCHYVSEPGLPEDSKRLRMALLDLHDACRRSRVLKGMAGQEATAGSAEIIAELRNRIVENPAHKNLSPEERGKALSGDTIYLGGIREAARTAGWQTKNFDAIYTYLSMQSHMAPMSFHRMDEQIDFITPTDFQLYFSAFCLEHARLSVAACAIRVFGQFPDIPQRLASEEMEVLLQGYPDLAEKWRGM